MAVCKQCGAQIGDQDTICPNCGANQQSGPMQANPQQYNSQVPMEEDKGGFLWGLLGCCIPIVGLILFLVWKDSKPKTAKAAGIGALVAVVCAVIYYIVIIVIGVGVGLFA